MMLGRSWGTRVGDGTAYCRYTPTQARFGIMLLSLARYESQTSSRICAEAGRQVLSSREARSCTNRRKSISSFINLISTPTSMGQRDPYKPATHPNMEHPIHTGTKPSIVWASTSIAVTSPAPTSALGPPSPASNQSGEREAIRRQPIIGQTQGDQISSYSRELRSRKCCSSRPTESGAQEAQGSHTKAKIIWSMFKGRLLYAQAAYNPHNCWNCPASVVPRY